MLATAGQNRALPPRTHESGVPQHNMVPPQPQQQMGVGHMGMYSGVMPYGILPGMHQQVRAQLAVLSNCLAIHSQPSISSTLLNSTLNVSDSNVVWLLCHHPTLLSTV